MNEHQPAISARWRSILVQRLMFLGNPKALPSGPSLEGSRKNAADKAETYTSERWLMCRPLGGLNDVLCQIERCADYALKTGRRLIVDIPSNTLTHHIISMFEPSSILSGTVLFPSKGLLSRLNEVSTFPSEISGRLSEYRVQYLKVGSLGKWVERETGAHLSFDFARDYTEDLLVHQQSGGGILSQRLLSRLELTATNALSVLKTLANRPRSSIAVHIRNTDVKTDYVAPLERVARFAGGAPVLLCSDSNEVVEYAKQPRLASTFSTFGAHAKNAPLHQPTEVAQSGDLEFLANRTLAEFVAMANSALFFRVLTGSRLSKARFSGFSNLVAWAVVHKTKVPMLKQVSTHHGDEALTAGKVVSLGPRGHRWLGALVAFRERVAVIRSSVSVCPKGQGRTRGGGTRHRVKPARPK